MTKHFNSRYARVETFRRHRRRPDFDNLLKVFRREAPPQPTLFEFAMNPDIYNALTAEIAYDANDPLRREKQMVDAFRLAGYDFVAMSGSPFHFPIPRPDKGSKSSVSLNTGAPISDRGSFERYAWPNPDDCDYSVLEKIVPYLPDGMKVIVYDPYGVLETVIDLVGYETLCFMVLEDPDFAQELFDQVGERLRRYHELCASFPSVGAHFLGDDWGFNQQTTLSPEHMRRYVLPWHKKAVQTIHAAGKPAILHSCGNLAAVMDDIIDDLSYDAKHSFEDKIQPVEAAWQQYGGRIALLGGIDVDFLCRATPEAVYARSAAMLEKTNGHAYALGSGNSIPEYVPMESYFAMNAAAVFE